VIIALAEAGDRPLAQVGGKASALGRLIAAGAPVPPGFVVPPGNLEEAEVLSAFDKLTVKSVAVRSSAAGEDSEAKSWAGQFDTFLNVGRSQLLARIADCRRSGASARAQAYDRSGIAMPVAVIVQAMVPADTAGVLFTANPVTGDRGQIMIEAVRGLGEQLVSGTVTPDNYVFAKSGAAVSQTLSGAEQVLIPTERTELAKISVRLEKAFGHPLDIEWAYAKGKMYILQARPITTLPGGAT
jgi:pyruvate,water dikinase